MREDGAEFEERLQYLAAGTSGNSNPAGRWTWNTKPGRRDGNICPAALFQVAVYARLFRRVLLYESGSICSSVKQG